VLASYAIAANYFGGIEIKQVFDDYCRHYGISKFNMCKYLCGASQITPEKCSEFAYDSHFHDACKNSGMSGLEFVKNLHDYSINTSFLRSREIFALSYYSDKKLYQHFKSIQEDLIWNDALLIAAFNEGRHIAVFGFDNNRGWFTVENRPTNIGIQFIPSIQEYCAVGDALKAFKRNRTNRQPDD